MLADSKSLRSTNLPARICPTVLAGIGEKPGPTTKGWFSMGTDGRLDKEATFPNGTGHEPWEVPVAGVVIELSGALNVVTKEGTTKAGLPWDAVGAAEAKGDENPAPEANKAVARAPKSAAWEGTPPIPGTGKGRAVADETATPGTVAGSDEDEELSGNRASFTASTTAAKKFGSTALAPPKGVTTEDGGEGALDVYAREDVVADDEGSGEKAALDKLLFVVRVEGMTPRKDRANKRRRTIEQNHSSRQTANCSQANANSEWPLSEQSDENNCMKASQRVPARTPGPPLWPLWGKTADPHCFELNLA